MYLIQLDHHWTQAWLPYVKSHVDIQFLSSYCSNSPPPSEARIFTCRSANSKRRSLRWILSDAIRHDGRWWVSGARADTRGSARPAQRPRRSWCTVTSSSAGPASTHSRRRRPGACEVFQTRAASISFPSASGRAEKASQFSVPRTDCGSDDWGRARELEASAWRRCMAPGPCSWKRRRTAGSGSALCGDRPAWGLGFGLAATEIEYGRMFR